MNNKVSLSAFFLCLLSAFSVHADTAAAPNPMGSGLLILGMIVLMYFMLIRPQNKKAKEHRNLVANLQKGDEVITSGGVLGKITKITDHFMVLTVATDVEITVQRQAVTNAIPKGTIKSI